MAMEFLKYLFLFSMMMLVLNIQAYQILKEISR